ncbi:MAG: (2Fe-2S)-binding protein [Pseudomonadota bacterium]
MIVCHCNILTRVEIEDTIDALLLTDPSRRLTPGMVYRDLGRRGRCCGCFPVIVALIVAAVDARYPDLAGADEVRQTGDAVAAE